ncbi:MAG: hydrogenase maturation protease [Gammaproteobacteria bacterium]|nr:hydrogenase maturation protease [Gammaproteobacteria bacterium]
MTLELPSSAGPGAPRLVIGIGNPSRGDDAIGPLAIARLEALAPPGVTLLTDFQLQVEHALDLLGASEVYFVDASVVCAAPFELVPLAPAADATATTHELSPAAVLETCRRLGAGPLPPAWVLAVRGYEFDLGTPLSAAAAANLDAAFDALLGRLFGPARYA